MTREVASESTPPELTLEEKGALAEKIIQRDPKTGVEQLAVLKEFQKNAESSAKGYPEGSLQRLGAVRLCSVLAATAEEQEEVNSVVGNLGPEYGSAFCMPGQGILCTGVLAQLFGEKPLADLATFTKKYDEIKAQIQERAAEVIKESVGRMKEEVTELTEYIRMIISREKSMINGAVKNRKDSGWFGALSRGLTLSDPYQIEIDKARRTTSVMQDIAVPMLKEAEAALNKNPPDLQLAHDRIESVTGLRKNANKVDTDTSHYELEQEALSVTQDVSIAVIVTLPTLGTGGAAMGGGKLAWEGAKLGTKLGYQAATKGLTYLAVGTAVAGGTSALLRDKEETTQTPDEAEKMNEIAQIAEMPMADRMELIANKMLNQIPDGEGYTFSPELLMLAMGKSENIVKLLVEYTKETDLKKRGEILAQVVEGIEESSGDMMQQFLNDNVDPTTSQRFAEAREDRKQNDTMRIGKIVGQINILEPLSRGDREGAMEAARQYVRNDIIGIQEQDVPPATTNKVLEDMARSIVAVTEFETYPILVQAIQSYSKTGFTESFKSRVGGIANFVGDVVSAPFNEEASGRVTKGYTAISTIVSQGKGDDLVMGMISFAKTACNVAMDHVQALDLLETLGGSMALDALIIAGTAGAGAGLKAAEDAGKVTETTARGIRMAGTVASVANTVMGQAQKPHTYSKPITLTGLNQKIAQTVDSTVKIDNQV